MGANLAGNCYEPGLLLQPPVIARCCDIAAARDTFAQESTSASSDGPRLQESDLLEKRPQGENDCDPETNAIRLVSLGCYCGVKSSFQKIGRGAEHLPFDWMRTSLGGIAKFINNDFDGFYDYFPPAKPIKAPPGKNMRMVLYRHYQHSFWHDDPTDPSMREKYHRRIERFRQIDATHTRVLFVRAAVSHAEIPASLELLALLKRRFGNEAKLLLILLRQRRLRGPAVLQGCPDLLLWYHNTDAQPAAAAFVDAVKSALNWAAGRQYQAMLFRRPEEAGSWTDPFNIIYAYGHYVFEGLGIDGIPPPQQPL